MCFVLFVAGCGGGLGLSSTAALLGQHARLVDFKARICGLYMSIWWPYKDSRI